jgi:hypothetical protein
VDVSEKEQTTSQIEEQYLGPEPDTAKKLEEAVDEEITKEQEVPEDKAEEQKEKTVAEKLEEELDEDAKRRLHKFTQPGRGIKLTPEQEKIVDEKVKKLIRGK